jgi:uncharacterized protein YndB with AHSA1/START domain
MEGGLMTENIRYSVEGTLHTIDGVGTVRMKARFATGIDDLWSALTDPTRLARWYGDVQGDLREEGEFTAFVFASEWNGRGRIEKCIRPQHLRVTQWEEESAKHTVSADLVADGADTVLFFATSGMPTDLLWAYGAGWQAHLEDLGAHIAGQDPLDVSTSTGSRMDELDLIYHAMDVVAQ